MADCLSEAELAEFLRDSLAPERMDETAAQPEPLRKCRDRLARLTPDIAGAALRHPPGPGPPPGEPPTDDGGASFSEARTLPHGSNTPLHIPHPRPSGLPNVPGFDILAEIGRGGMGIVYKARHRKLNRLVALKMILAGAAADPRTVQRFLFEAEILARIQHPQVVQVYEVDTFAGANGVPVPYLAIELLEGGSLGKRLKAGPLDVRAAAELVEGIARAVHAVHTQGVIHRDLKPGNILFPESGDRIRNGDRRQETSQPRRGKPKLATSLSPSPVLLSPKVTDFGLAKFIQAGADLTGTGQVVGTPQYMAPEQAAGSRQIGPAADVYSLGAILFECLSGRPPFQGDDPMSVLVKVVMDTSPDVRSLRPGVPRDLGAVVARCLDKDPRRRYATAEELANDLRRYLDNRPTKRAPPPPASASGSGRGATPPWPGSWQRSALSLCSALLP